MEFLVYICSLCEFIFYTVSYVFLKMNPFPLFFLFPSWCAVRSYRPHLEERDPIWGDDWSHIPFIGRSPSWGFLGFSSAVRKMPGDLCTAPRIITLIISDRRDWRRDTRGKWPLARNPDRSWWHRHTSISYSFSSPWFHVRKNKSRTFIWLPSSILFFFLSCLPWPSLTGCAILPNSIGGKRTPFDEIAVRTAFIRRSHSWDFPEFSSAVR